MMRFEYNCQSMQRRGPVIANRFYSRQVVKKDFKIVCNSNSTGFRNCCSQNQLSARVRTFLNLDHLDYYQYDRLANPTPKDAFAERGFAAQELAVLTRDVSFER